MTPEERIALNISLWQRFLGHEGHELIDFGPVEEPDDYRFRCFECMVYLRDLTTDGNAMLALIAALEAQGWTVDVYGRVESLQVKCVLHHYIDDSKVIGKADTRPEAVALAAAQIPEAKA